MLKWMCSMTRLDRFRYKYMRKNLGVTNIVRETRENILRWFSHVYRKSNEDIVKKIAEIRIEGNRGRFRRKKKCMEIIREGIGACGVDEDMVRDRKG